MPRTEKASRLLFLAECAVLLAPAAIFLTAVSVTLVAAIAGSLGQKLFATGISGLPALHLRSWLLGLGLVGMAAMAVAGLVALAKLSRVALAFLRDGRSGLPAVRATFWSGAKWGLVPLAFMIAAILEGGETPGWMQWLALPAWPLLLPILHLALEIRRVPR